MRRYQRKKIPGHKALRKHQHDPAVINIKFQGIAELLLPGRSQRQSKGPVYLASPEGMDNNLFTVLVQGVDTVFEQNMVAVGQWPACSLLLPLEKPGEPFKRLCGPGALEFRMRREYPSFQLLLGLFQEKTDLLGIEKIPVLLFRPPEGYDVKSLLAGQHLHIIVRDAHNP